MWLVNGGYEKKKKVISDVQISDLNYDPTLVQNNKYP